MKNWFQKIKAEFNKSKMNPIQFLYWTIRSDIDEIKRKRQWQQRAINSK